MPRTALVTGSAGFIGYHLCARLLALGWQVTGLDAMTPYYDPALKRARHARLAREAGFRAVEAPLESPGLARALLEGTRPEIVVHLAAQAGVRHSITAPESYVAANLQGSFALLEAARARPPAHLLLASTSSVYGASPALPYLETDRADWPLSFYAATKKAVEAMAHSYAHLYGLPVTVVRFFTVYGPWGRPDMALFRFTHAILAGEPIEVFGQGAMRRDFTYVADLVEGIVRLIGVVPPAPGPARPPPLAGDSLSPAAPWRVVNLGHGAPVALADFIAAVEAAAGRPAQRRLLPMQAGDVPATWASTALAEALVGPLPRTPLAEGVAAFVAWYRAHFGL